MIFFVKRKYDILKRKKMRLIFLGSPFYLLLAFTFSFLQSVYFYLLLNLLGNVHIKEIY